MNLETSPCVSACWALSSRLQHPHCTGVFLLSPDASTGTTFSEVLGVCRSPCVKLCDWLIAFNPDLVKELWIFWSQLLVRKGTFPVTHLGWTLFHWWFQHASLPRVFPFTSAAVQSCSHHSTFLRRQAFFISLLDWKDFHPAGGLSPSLPALLVSQAGTQTHWMLVSASHLSRELIKPWGGREHTYTEFKLLCRGYDLKNCCLGRQTTLLCLVLKGHTVLISGLVFSPPALL